MSHLMVLWSDIMNAKARARGLAIGPARTRDDKGRAPM
jgi:hypothetical protein